MVSVVDNADCSPPPPVMAEGILTNLRRQAPAYFGRAWSHRIPPGQRFARLLPWFVPRNLWDRGSLPPDTRSSTRIFGPLHAPERRCERLSEILSFVNDLAVRYDLSVQVMTYYQRSPEPRMRRISNPLGFPGLFPRDAPQFENAYLQEQVGRQFTIFLDEVGEIPVELQSKLLRVLQEGDLERIGEDHARHGDVRVIAATNRDLSKEVEAGFFRKDLYYRLCVFPIYLPPLRERREDIAQLAAHLMKTTSERLNFPQVLLTDHALDLLNAYDWPGNIRELQNVIERAIIVTRCGPLRIDLVLGDTRKEAARAAAASGQNAQSTTPADKVLSAQEMERREYANTLAALTKSNWKIYGPGGAAEILGTKPTALASRMKRLGIKRPT